MNFKTEIDENERNYVGFPHRWKTIHRKIRSGRSETGITILSQVTQGKKKEERGL